MGVRPATSGHNAASQSHFTPLIAEYSDMPTACANRGGTALPICRAAETLPPTKCQSSSKSWSFAFMRSVNDGLKPGLDASSAVGAFSGDPVVS